MAKQLLKDISVRNAKPADKDIRLNDGSGLYLLVKINGAKWWRFDYSINGRRKNHFSRRLSSNQLGRCQA
ncbi:Arm DNA-binding domain-containing protein [Methylomonas koyamae]|uniref:Arm DNA-binding domain-containing protein n=1 Tax=Methylomonas koyamae TaxID=702114 RepID=UPI0035C23BD2